MTIKKLTLLTPLFLFLLLGVGCQKQKEQAVSLPYADGEPQIKTVSETAKQEKSEIVIKTESAKAGTSIFRGTWFDIEHPKNFIARPATPMNVYNNVTHVLTDEAYFTSPDGTVEFFVYSPLWSGDPENYLVIDQTEEVVDEKTEEIKESEQPGQFGGKIVHWLTIKAKDGSYYRSFVSTKEQVGTGSGPHHVFGIKYKDSESYEKYREAYLAFKESLQQYGD